MELKIYSMEVKAEVKQLRCKVTREMVSDINTLSSLDFDSIYDRDHHLSNVEKIIDRYERSKCRSEEITT